MLGRLNDALQTAADVVCTIDTKSKRIQFDLNFLFSVGTATDTSSKFRISLETCEKFLFNRTRNAKSAHRQYKFTKSFGTNATTVDRR